MSWFNFWKRPKKADSLPTQPSKEDLILKEIATAPPFEEVSFWQGYDIGFREGFLLAQKNMQDFYLHETGKVYLTLKEALQTIYQHYENPEKYKRQK